MLFARLIQAALPERRGEKRVLFEVGGNSGGGHDEFSSSSWSNAICSPVSIQ
jgi:hypothetical protein